MRRRLILTLPVAVLSALQPRAAAAAASSVVAYSLNRTFSSALRLLRVDKQYLVTEKDASAAYLLFDYPKPGGSNAFGAIELVELDKGVRVSVTIPALPGYHARSLRDELIRKLRREYGVVRKSKSDKDKNPSDSEQPKQPEIDGEAGKARQ